jgi:hypothetical protein
VRARTSRRSPSSAADPSAGFSDAGAYLLPAALTTS